MTLSGLQEAVDVHAAAVQSGDWNRIEAARVGVLKAGATYDVAMAKAYGGEQFVLHPSEQMRDYGIRYEDMVLPKIPYLSQLPPEVTRSDKTGLGPQYVMQSSPSGGFFDLGASAGTITPAGPPETVVARLPTSTELSIQQAGQIPLLGSLVGVIYPVISAGLGAIAGTLGLTPATAPETASMLTTLPVVGWGFAAERSALEFIARPSETAAYHEYSTALASKTSELQNVQAQISARGIALGYKTDDQGRLQIPESDTEIKTLFTRQQELSQSITSTTQQAEAAGVIQKRGEGYIPGVGQSETGFAGWLRGADIAAGKFTQLMSPTQEGMQIWRTGTERMYETARGLSALPVVGPDAALGLGSLAVVSDIYQRTTTELRERPVSSIGIPFVEGLALSTGFTALGAGAEATGLTGWLATKFPTVASYAPTVTRAAPYIFAGIYAAGAGINVGMAPPEERPQVAVRETLKGTAFLAGWETSPYAISAVAGAAKSAFYYGFRPMGKWEAPTLDLSVVQMGIEPGGLPMKPGETFQTWRTEPTFGQRIGQLTSMLRGEPYTGQVGEWEYWRTVESPVRGYGAKQISRADYMIQPTPWSEVAMLAPEEGAIAIPRGLRVGGEAIYGPRAGPQAGPDWWRPSAVEFPPRTSILPETPESPASVEVGDWFFGAGETRLVKPAVTSVDILGVGTTAQFPESPMIATATPAFPYFTPFVHPDNPFAIALEMPDYTAQLRAGVAVTAAARPEAIAISPPITRVSTMADTVAEAQALAMPATLAISMPSTGTGNLPRAMALAYIESLAGPDVGPDVGIMPFTEVIPLPAAIPVTTPISTPWIDIPPIQIPTPWIPFGWPGFPGGGGGGFAGPRGFYKSKIFGRLGLDIATFGPGHVPELARLPKMKMPRAPKMKPRKRTKR
jgi:hypothetical protein